MSKAFTRESDDAPEPRPTPRLPSALPPGTKNYLTRTGATRIENELKQLVEVERPPLASKPDDPECRRQLQALDQKVFRLNQVVQSAVVVDPPEPPWEQVRFGATVTVRNLRAEEETYRVVGVDEIDLDRNHVSWLSPIAKALLNGRLGERVRFKFPTGEDQLEIIRIVYE